MGLDIIENSGPDNLRDTLKFQLARASEVSIAVAFVTQSGLDEIIQTLRQVAAHGHVRLLTGLYQKVTEPEALWSLLRIQNETKGRFSVRLSREPQFHRKFYLFSCGTRCVAIVGSSNLTRDGLRSGGELNVIVRSPKASLSTRKIIGAFDRDWEHRAVALDAGQIREYEKRRPKTVRWKSCTRAELARILGATTSHEQATDDHEAPSFWRDCTTGIAKKRTQQIVSETTDWDDRNYWWSGTGGSHSYRLRDRIFMFDFHDHCVRLVEVKGIARTKVRTPDGRHFIAYRPVAGVARRFSKKLWSALKGEHVNSKTAHDRRRVHSEKAKRLRMLIRPSKRR